METTKLFENGCSQAVRLPKRYAFSGSEVYVTKVNGIEMLVPKGKGVWKPFLESLDMFSDDYRRDKRKQGNPERRESLA